MKLHTGELKEKELLDSIRRMAAMAEYRDPDAATHRERVRSFSFLIARCMGLASPEVEILANASLLHDIGKVGLPEAVNFKSGDLSPYEWEMMKRHTTIGASILKGSPSVVLQAAEIIALTHHERWDGSGYPNGLKGEEIPLSGRICALADVFDALTTRRTYKAEVPVEEAIKMVADSGGLLFDPQVVNVFLEHQLDILRIRSANLSRPLLEMQ